MHSPDRAVEIAHDRVPELFRYIWPQRIVAVRTSNGLAAEHLFVKRPSHCVMFRVNMMSCYVEHDIMFELDMHCGDLRTANGRASVRMLVSYRPAVEESPRRPNLMRSRDSCGPRETRALVTIAFMSDLCLRTLLRCDLVIQTWGGVSGTCCRHFGASNQNHVNPPNFPWRVLNNNSYLRATTCNENNVQQS